jgi:predicted Abi (CAAX) family protease
MSLSFFKTDIVASSIALFKLEIIQTHSKIPQYTISNILQSAQDLFFPFLVNLVDFYLQSGNFLLDKYVIWTRLIDFFILLKSLFRFLLKLIALA